MSAPAAGPTLSEAGDEERRRGLTRMRGVALGLLLLAALVFVLTHGRDDGFLGYVNAASEAAMVGAVADWFAVTAIFRHPLGLPIPHTALIPRRKDALGQSLETFVRDNFLTESAVRERYAAAQVAQRAGAWLRTPEHARRVVDEAAPLLRRVLDRVGHDDVEALLDQVLLPRLREEPLSPVAGSLLEAVVADGTHHGVVDIVARELHDWLAENREQVEQILAARAPWWSPQWLDDRVVERLRTELVAWSAEVRDDPDHRVRRALDSYLERLARDLQHEPDTRERLESLKVRVLDHPQTRRTVLALWDTAARVLRDALEEPDGPLRVRAADEIRRLGQSLTTDAALRERVDALGADAAAVLVRRYGSEVTTIISTTITRWDGREAAERIELHVGRDLQFIRINGTVVGGLVGLLIHGGSQLVEAL